MDRSVEPGPKGNGAIRIWTKDGPERRNGAFINDDPDLCGDLIPTDHSCKASTFGFSDTNLTVTFYVEGVYEADFIHTYADVLAHDRPTMPITVNCYPNGSDLVLTDVVNYIVACPDSFYNHLLLREELRASLAAQGIYERADLQKYGSSGGSVPRG